MNEASGRPTALRASVFTRLVYVTALAGTVVGWIAAGSPWIGLALGVGPASATGRSTFVVVAAAIAYRVYTVLRSPGSLDARPPYLAGWLLRGIGWLLMAAGAVGSLSLFAVKPIALRMFGSPGDGGIAFFVTGLLATLMAWAGPLGCALFEASRRLGRKPPVPAQSRDAPRHRKHAAMLASVAAVAILAMAWPSLLRVYKGPVSGQTLQGRCVAPVLLDCAATIEGTVRRVAALPEDGSVRLRSDIEAIEYRYPGLKHAVVDSVTEAVAEAGYRVAPDGDVRVDVAVTSSGSPPVLLVRVIDKAGELARFTTTFARGARIEATNGGARRVVVDLGRDVMLPLLPMPARDGAVHLPDGLYAQVRQVLLSEREAAVLAAASDRTAAVVSSTSAPPGYKYSDRNLVRNCNGVAEVHARTAREKSLPPFVDPQHEVSFTAGGQRALLKIFGFVSCHDGAVWFMRYDHRAGLLYVRRHDTQGKLQRAWRVTLPKLDGDVSLFVEPEMVHESDGQVQLRMFAMEGFGHPKQQFISFAFPQ